jgi:hypothetical protein
MLLDLSSLKLAVTLSSFKMQFLVVYFSLELFFSYLICYYCFTQLSVHFH